MHGETFFARHASADEETMKFRHRDDQAGVSQRHPQFCQPDVLTRLPDREDVRRSLLDPARTQVTALRLGGKGARVAPTRMPTIAVEGATPNRAAAARQLNPLSIAAKRRERDSSKAGDPSTPASFTSKVHESQNAAAGNPCRFIPIGIRSSATARSTRTTAPPS